MGNKHTLCQVDENGSVDLTNYKRILVISLPSNYLNVVRQLGGISSGKTFRLYVDYHRDGNIKFDCILVDGEIPYYYEFAKSVYPRLKRNTKDIFLLKGDNYIKKLNFK